MKPPVSAKLESLTPAWISYELLDTGGSRKLERFGSVTLVRPEPQADWRPHLPREVWGAAHAQFVQADCGRRGEWTVSKPIPDPWLLRRELLTFSVQLTPSGHVGVFPDQAAHWDWLAATVPAAPNPPTILSLFGHTGLATLSAAAAGALVTHVDASRKAVAWARQNQSLSQLNERPIRWIVDDAATFVAREVRRGHTYDGLILDPPRFGRGPGGELWKVADALPALLRDCRKLLSPSPLFVLLNTYTTVLTRRQTGGEATRLQGLLKEMLQDYRPSLTAGELFLADSANRRLSASVFARARF